jgi:predicted ribosomally synthesized peptide with SipW-like signal peptide
MKKKLFVLAALAICAAIITTGSYAFFSTKMTAHNVITTGKVGVAILNKLGLGGPSALVEDFPEGGIKLLPGDTVYNSISVRNTEEEPVWVRVHVDTVASGNFDPAPFLTLDLDSVHWVDGGDGYYYYKEALIKDAATEPLLRSISVASSMGDNYQGCTIGLGIAAEAVQQANNPAPDGDVTAVGGWPN